MIMSRQFRALAKVALWFSGVWAAVGAVIAVITTGAAPDGGLLSEIGTHLLMYGTLGAMSGLVTGLVLARGERGRRVEQVSTRRVVGWGVLGGVAPSILFGLLGLVFGAPATVYLPLIGLGVVSAGIGGAVAGSAAAVSKRGALEAPRGATPVPPR
ncbi:MAG: hypothetical protein HOP28_09440 [Gemmatimonadales bacterium]|nr:hypothetical protein [Gemmatimonadales bacterium]